MKTVIFGLFFVTTIVSVHGQSLIGKWQLTKQTSCIENELETDETTADLADDMKSKSAATAQIVKFKDNKSGEESTRILSRRKDANSKPFLYRFDGTNLHILDKRSQTISESYIVEKLDAESMVLTNATRACDTKVFVRIKD